MVISGICIAEHGPEEHRVALDGIGRIMMLDTPEDADLAMLETLAVLVERYKETAFLLDRPSPLDAIRFRMDQMLLSQAPLRSCRYPATF